MGVQGVNALLEHSVAKFDVGTTAYNPANPAQKLVYVQADDAVVAGNALTRDFAAAGSGSATNVPFLVTTTSAVAQSVVGISLIAITAGYYAWIVCNGPVTGANVTTALVAGNSLISSGTAGRFIIQPSTAGNPTKVDFDGLVAATGGVEVVATSTAAANVGNVVLC
jgi:hypothetical protein